MVLGEGGIEMANQGGKAGEREGRRRRSASKRGRYIFSSPSNLETILINFFNNDPNTIINADVQFFAFAEDFEHQARG